MVILDGSESNYKRFTYLYWTKVAKSTKFLVGYPVYVRFITPKALLQV